MKVKISNYAKRIYLLQQKACGQTKAKGERLIQAASCERLTVIDDQWSAPTGAELRADVTAHVVRQVLQRPQDAGPHHLAASGETT